MTSQKVIKGYDRQENVSERREASPGSQFTNSGDVGVKMQGIRPGEAYRRLGFWAVRTRITSRTVRCVEPPLFSLPHRTVLFTSEAHRVPAARGIISSLLTSARRTSTNGDPEELLKTNRK